MPMQSLPFQDECSKAKQGQFWRGKVYIMKSVTPGSIWENSEYFHGDNRQ